ncbi:hypothetical protein D3C71_1324190 [compost metagenome]
MALARCDGGFNFPDPVQFPAHLVGVEGFRGVYVVAFFRMELVQVVGDVHFLLADQLPVVAVWMADKGLHFIEVVGPGGDEVRGVVAHRRCATHPALAHQVLPRFTGVGGVDAVVGDQGFTGLERRLAGEKAQQHILTRPLLRVAAFVVVRVLPVLHAPAGEGARAVGVADNVVVAVLDGFGFGTQQGIPDQFVAVGRNRKRHTAVAALHRQTVLGQLALGGVLLRIFIGPRRRCGAAVGGVDLQVEAVRVLLQQGAGALAELVGVLRGVFRGNLQQGFFTGERVGRSVAELGPGHVLGQATGPGRNTAVFVASLFGTHWGQGAFQGIGLLGRDGR